MAIESTLAKTAYLESLFEKYGGLENSEAQFFLLIHHYNRGALTQTELYNLLRNSWKNQTQNPFRGQVGFWYQDTERTHKVDFGRLTSGELFLNYPFCEDAVTATLKLRGGKFSLGRKQVTHNTIGIPLFHNCGSRQETTRDWNQWFLEALPNAQPMHIPEIKLTQSA